MRAPSLHSAFRPRRGAYEPLPGAGCRPTRTRGVVGYTAATLWITSMGCGSSHTQEALAGAAITTAVAATVWVAAGGCRLQGCPWGSFCDEAEGRCEVRACTEGCPKGTHCNEQIDRCEDMPSVIQMNPPPYQPPSDPDLQQPAMPSIPY